MLLYYFQIILNYICRFSLPQHHKQLGKFHTLARINFSLYFDSLSTITNTSNERIPDISMVSTYYIQKYLHLNISGINKFALKYQILNSAQYPSLNYPFSNELLISNYQLMINNRIANNNIFVTQQIQNNRQLMKHKTVNGFSNRPSLAQIVGYIVFLLEVVVLYSVVLPIYNSYTAYIVIMVLFSVSLVFLVLSTVISSFIDPSDQVMINIKSGKPYKVCVCSSSQLQDCLYCQYCRTYVKSKSKHCRSCNRCTENFDHHCMWINNCVGGKNYIPFGFMIVATWTNLGLYITSMVLLSFQNTFREFLFRFIFGWVICVPITILWILITNLILFHCYLSYKGISTYDFILSSKDEEKKNIQNIYPQVPKKSEITQQHQINQLNIISQNNPHQSKMENKSKMPILEQNNVIFEKDITEKSEGQISIKPIQGQIQREESEQSIRISQFFTRNKSLRLFVDSNVPRKPISRSSRTNLTTHQSLAPSTMKKFVKKESK